MLSEFDYKRIVQALGHAERNASDSEKSNWRSVLRNFEMEYSKTATPMPIAVEQTEELLGHKVGELSQHLGHRITITQFKDYFTSAVTDYSIECLEEICEGGDVRIGEPEIILTFDEQLAHRVAKMGY
jgi:hypothetical protein